MHIIIGTAFSKKFLFASFGKSGIWKSDDSNYSIFSTLDTPLMQGISNMSNAITPKVNTAAGLFRCNHRHK